MSTEFINSGGPSPENSTGIVGRWLFTYLDGTLLAGYRQPLQSRDVFELPDKARATLQTEAFLKAWDEAAAQAKDNPGQKKHILLRTLTKVHLRSILVAAIPRFLADTSAVCAPLIILFLVRYLSNVADPNFVDTPWYGYVLAVALLLLQVIQTLCISRNVFPHAQIGFAMRMALISATFRKMLRLSPRARAHLTSGKIINVIVSDTNRIDLAMQNIANIYSAPYIIILATTFLCINLGPIALIGVAVLCLYLPFQNLIQKTMSKMRTRSNLIADQRIRITSETLSGIRVIKAYAWEKSFEKVIADLRVRELRFQRVYLLLRSSISGLSQVIPALAMVATFVSYRAIYGSLDPARVFSSLAQFYVLRSPLLMIPLTISTVTDAWIGIGRIQDVLLAEELTTGPKMLPAPDPSDEKAMKLPAIEVVGGEFTWSQALSGDAAEVAHDASNAKPSNANASGDKKGDNKENGGGVVVEANQDADSDIFKLYNINISVARGDLVAIVGTVGSGKSSFLQALVGEMRRTSGDVVLRGSVGWVPQSAWILNQTVKQNILFGQVEEKERYDSVVRQCALEADLKILPAGDETEIGEKGINLSGGQKQRLSLARAVYFGADIILLDDPLSAVDSHVGRYLFENCIKGALKDKTRILVTHQLHFLPQVDRVIVIDGGRVVEDGTFDELMAIERGKMRIMMEEFGGLDDKSSDGDKPGDGSGKEHVDANADAAKMTGGTEADTAEKEALLSPSISQPPRTFESDANPVVPDLTEEAKQDAIKKGKNKLIVKEERDVGNVRSTVFSRYVALGGGWPMWSIVIFGAASSQVSRIMTDNWLAFWSQDRYGLSLTVYESVYIALGFSQAVFLLVFSFSLVMVGLWASQRMHELAITRVLRAPLSFFDTTPLGRLVTRFSRDVDMNDSTLPETFRTVIFTFTMTIANFGAIAAIFPVFLAFMLPALFLYFFLQRYYSSSSREVRRLDSVTRSPLFAHVSETLTGIATVRAYARQPMFTKRNTELLDTNGRMYYLAIALPMWLTIRLETISNLLIFLACTFAVVYRYSVPPGLSGLVVSYAINVTGVFNWCVRQTSELEQNMNSVERVTYLSDDVPVETDFVIKQNEKDAEAPEISTTANAEGVPPKDWPKEGVIEFDKVKMRYRPELPLVLKGVSFCIPAGSKVGIVGRTGSGKSSTLLAILRLVENSSGTTRIDGIDISTVRLDLLRSRIAVIPQDPVLFSGTVRFNLDPFNEYDDEQVWKALEKSDLKEVISAHSMGLDANVAENGENFSTGQRQLICLARAMLRSSRIILLDEATASVDLATDDFIQKAIRTDFKDATVITIAHRLNTIADATKVLVLSQGVVLEEGSPADLLMNPDGAFSRMVAETGKVNEAQIRALAGLHD